MAETRKYDPTTGDPIGDAVRAALGETIRPAAPGPKQAPTSSDAPTSEPGPQPKAGPRRPPVATIGSYVFTAVPKKPDA